MEYEDEKYLYEVWVKPHIEELQNEIELLKKEIELIKKITKSPPPFKEKEFVIAVIDGVWRDLRIIKNQIYIVKKMQYNIDCNSFWKVYICGHDGGCDSSKFKSINNHVAMAKHLEDSVLEEF